MLTKIVNGIEVQMSADEDAATSAEWDANDPAKLPAQPRQATLDDIIAVLPKASQDALDAKLINAKVT